MDHDYLLYLVNSYDDDALLSPLRSYIFEESPVIQEKCILHFNKGELVELFLLNLSFCCLKAKEDYPNMSEAAIDALCVSGLIQFPPSEGGPLNYFVRNGKENCTIKFKKFITHFLANKFENVSKVGSKVDALYSEVCSDTLGSVGLSGIRSEGIYLTANELRAIGPACGILNKEVFLFLIGFNVLVLLIVLFVFLVFLLLI